ncbi:MAG TPA: alpha/beta hydrolase [Actinospica sp.]|jgi:pimeloyl-ACP methyl ester carboxylesterase|nr:alpha/beta hydrolase [Actinospica sp.]
MTTTTVQLTAKDGTTLAVDSVGQGDTTLILIGGAFNDRSTVAGLGAELAGQYTVLSYDRRGRGASDDKASDYAVANEVDDLAAVISHAGGHAGVFGHSSGAVLALEGAMAGLPIDRLAVYEPPYTADESLPRPSAEVYERLKDLVAAGDKGGAAELFLGECVGVPEEGLTMMKEGPAWGFLTDKAPSLPYDVLLSKPWELLPAERLAALSVPLLAVYGDRTALGLAAATRALATTVPGAELVLIEGEDHAVLQRPAVLAPILAQFFG